MRRAGLFALVMLLALPAGAEGAKRSPCKPKGAKTLDAGSHAHIFRVVNKRGDRRTSVVYGCLSRGAKRRVLGRVTHDGYYEAGVAVIQARVFGRSVGFLARVKDSARGKYMQGSAGDTLSVANLRTGRLVRSVQLPDNSSVLDWEATRAGGIAWIQQNKSPFGPLDPALQVFKHDRGGQALLDSGPQVTSDSLALSASTLYWMNAGQARSATLR